MGGKRRRIHSTQPCPEGVTKKIWDSETWLSPLEAQIRGLRLDDATVSAIVAALVQPDHAIVPIDGGGSSVDGENSRSTSGRAG